MEIIKLDLNTTTGVIGSGEVINNIDSKLWIERYSTAGEFELTAGISSNIHKKLPLGSLITHDGTYDAMFVENHEISSKKGEETKVKITGRSFEVVYERRVVGLHLAWNASVNDVSRIEVTYMGYPHWILASIIGRSTLESGSYSTYNIRDVIPNLGIGSQIFRPEVNQNRKFKYGELYSQILEILANEDLGLRFIRPGAAAANPSSDTLMVYIIDGYDRSDTVSFSYDKGDIESAEYFWSNKDEANVALATGKWVGSLTSNLLDRGYNRRVTHVDASDIDGQQPTNPAGTARSDYRQLIRQRGEQDLLRKRRVGLISAEVTKDFDTYIYRRDYQIGDIVTVYGEYDEKNKMRVVEYIESEDKDGSSSYPTLALYEGD